MTSKYTTREVTSSEDTIDTRDLIERIEDLISLRDNEPDDFGEDDAAELERLEEFAKEVEPYCPDYRYGETLIRDSYFKDYIIELVQDCYNIPDGWPFRCIDWQQAADEARVDYSSAEFDGVTYWFR